MLLFFSFDAIFATTQPRRHVRTKTRIEIRTIWSNPPNRAPTVKGAAISRTIHVGSSTTPENISPIR